MLYIYDRSTDELILAHITNGCYQDVCIYSLGAPSYLHSYMEKVIKENTLVI